MSSEAIALMLLGLVFFGTIVGVSVYIYFGRLYFRTRIANEPVPLLRMMRMRSRGVDINRVINAFLDARKAGVGVSLDELEEHARVRGDVRKVVDALIAAENAGKPMELAQARSLDLQGKDPMESVKQ